MEAGELYIGVMSGTSLDGVDTVLVRFDQNKLTLLAESFYPVPEQLKQALLDIVIGQETTLKTIGELDHCLGHLYADAIKQLLDQSGYQAQQIKAIGNHGQTVFHQPDGTVPFTMQLGDANIIASKTGITTVADFRRKDMAYGGQGAPLVPAFHQSIFQANHSSVVVLNIGGIANISVLRPNIATIGYDTGPGNMLLDSWIAEQRSQPFDLNAEFALSGTVNKGLLALLLQDDFFSKPAPKSTGRERFNHSWLNNKLAEYGQKLAAEDVQATLVELTVITIRDEVRQYSNGTSPELLVCGGGANNPLIMARLNQLLTGWTVATTDERGISSDYMEAIAFAWLAKQRIHNLPSNLPQVTGATRLVSLGVIYPADTEEV